MDTQNKSYFDILKVSPHASDADIKLAYKQMAKIFHPDQNPTRRQAATERFKLINKAYHALSTQEKRKLYNASINKPAKVTTLKAENDNSYNRRPYDATAGSQSSWLGHIAQIFWPNSQSSGR